MGGIEKGPLDDHFLLGALSIVGSSKDWLLSIFPEKPDALHPQSHRISPFEGPALTSEQVFNSEGVYSVRFWRDGQWRIVVVDDRIPCGADGGPCFAQPFVDGITRSTSMWPLIVEKAYAKLNGSYESILSGGDIAEALYELTGAEIDDIRLRGSSRQNVNPDTFHEILSSASQAGGLLAAVSISWTGQGVSGESCPVRSASCGCSAAVWGQRHRGLSAFVVGNP